MTPPEPPIVLEVPPEDVPPLSVHLTPPLTKLEGVSPDEAALAPSIALQKTHMAIPSNQSPAATNFPAQSVMIALFHLSESRTLSPCRQNAKQG
jgi:hypothetical protein